MNAVMHSSDKVKNLLAQFVTVKIDGDEQPEVTKANKVPGYPTMIFFSPQGQEIQRKLGGLNEQGLIDLLSSQLK